MGRPIDGDGDAMGKLYDYAGKVQRHIEANNLDVFKTRGALAMECGFLVSMIGENDADDPERIAKLVEAARKVLGIDLER